MDACALLHTVGLQLTRGYKQKRQRLCTQLRMCLLDIVRRAGPSGTAILGGAVTSEENKGFGPEDREVGGGWGVTVAEEGL